MANLYEVMRNGEERGKFTSAQLRKMVAQGELFKDDLIRKFGSDSKWQKAGTVKSFTFPNKEPETIQMELEDNLDASSTHSRQIVEEDDLSSLMNRSDAAVTEFKEAISFDRENLPDKLLLLIQKNEEIVYTTRPSIIALIFRLVISAVVFAIPGLVLLVAINKGRASVPPAISLLLLLIILGILLVAIYIGWKNTYYVITKGRTIAMQGVFNVSVKIIINENIQIISINTGLIDRWLGLNTIKFSTAAHGGGIGGLSAGSLILRNVNVADVVPHYAKA